MRCPIAIIFAVLMFATRLAFAQVSCYTPQELLYFQAEGSFGYRLLTLPIPTYGPRLPAANTGYQFVSGTPGPGQYTIIRDTRGMHPDTWYEIDTRTDPNDGTYMMVMNASTVKTAQFYNYIIGAFCPNTKYTIPVWVYNLSKSNTGTHPNFTFKLSTVQGAERTVYNTGDIPGGNPNWVKYDITFTTPNVREDLQITMINNNPGGDGNVFALDNVYAIADAPTMTALLDADNSNRITVCGGANYSFPIHAVITNNYAHPRYQWQARFNSGQFYDLPGETNIAFTARISPNDPAAVMQYRLTSAEGDNIDCSDCRAGSLPVTVTINALPSASVISDLDVCEGDNLSLNSSGAVADQSYQWTGPGGFSSIQANPMITAATLADAGTYHVVVKSKALCVTEADVRVKVYPKVGVSTSGDVSICQGSSTLLKATGSAGVSYTWSPSAGLSDAHSPTITVSPAETTTYTVVVTSPSNCSARATMTVKVSKPPVVSAGSDITITEGDPLTLKGSVKGDNVSYYWTPADHLSDATSLTPKASPTGDITYTLHARNTDNCGGEVTDDVFIRVYKKVTIPNTFSPNGDGINDTWKIQGLENYPGCKLQVFNRYGQALFSSLDYPKAWDGRVNGKPLGNGTYYYMIDLKNGRVLSGWVTVVR